MTEAEIFYFTKDCDQLTEEDKQQVYASFKDVLDKKGVCKTKDTKLCDIKVF